MSDNVDELFSIAEELVKKSKRVMKVVYQLAFIVTSDSPDAKKAQELLDKMVEEGLVTKRQVWKAIDDVARWRDRVLDRLMNNDDYGSSRRRRDEEYNPDEVEQHG